MAETETDGGGPGRKGGARGIKKAEAKILRPPFRLVQSSHQSTETKACLRELLADAESKELIGIAYVAMYKSREWDYRTCGEANRNPGWSMGMLMAFIVKLANDLNRH